MEQDEIEKWVDERMSNIFWMVILKHLTPEVVGFIRQELIKSFNEGQANS